ncbi:MAG: SDR family oxidoreductase [SAR202 cluster bacterium]|jgi:3-oxoacyl-[acyl-carrier protein] reductase|nr:SDR family NAD(P)-dependent oxidoreductase [SAR202 cluster bacterium]HAL46761.1 3-oxoacyl-ACP reductase [Dehalococcoidia bacterium]MDP6662486.1 SDR family NAD(P)-dependent oxidoreductase [SAR202 cluster bacterium]MDP6800152.1 SDR family NAD(P)-dependent oxidoreductase [SAR202 cluster bacterium]MQG57370.1 SDR family oxidoreductase [SAR202 cluster bacterium]|tara:strand:- start:8436 stop:9218 length:783 start_codon:yes stop_codon:yes gene_type:complete
MRLEGKTAIITGAAQGLGRAIALDFASEGAAMLLADIQGEKVAQVAALIGENGGQAEAIEVDVTNASAVDRMVARALELYGSVDILVNDAGGSGNQGIQDITDVTEEQWDATVDVNLKSAFLCAKAIVPHMRERGYGRIVNLSSFSAKGNFGELGTTAVRLPYAAAKSGILGFTFQLARDLGPDGIYVNVVQPGFILTEPGARVHDRFEELPDDVRDRMTRATPLGRPGRPDDVAKAVTFLASDDASYTTGSVLEVTGGR